MERQNREVRASSVVEVAAEMGGEQGGEKGADSIMPLEPTDRCIPIDARHYVTVEDFRYHMDSYKFDQRERFDEMRDTLNAILEQTKLTNGRIGTLETAHKVLEANVQNASDIKARVAAGIGIGLAALSALIFGGKP